MSDEIKDIDNAVLGYKPRQKTDRKKYLKEWREKNKEHLRIYNREWKRNKRSPQLGSK